MTDREKLIELIQSAVDGCATYWAGLIADHLIAHGVTLQEHDCFWATEQAYKNGYEAGKPKWIPVSERLPKNFISVLVHIPDMNPCPAVLEAYRFDDGWVTKMAAFDIDCVTHWMPLPEPPKTK